MTSLGNRARPPSKKKKKKKQGKKVNIEISHNPAIPLLGRSLEELKAVAETDTSEPVFIRALFIIGKRREKPKCLSPNEWINKI